jgi:hypothetical protein
VPPEKKTECAIRKFNFTSDKPPFTKKGTKHRLGEIKL